MKPKDIFDYFKFKRPFGLHGSYATIFQRCKGFIYNQESILLRDVGPAQTKQTQTNI